jgi:RNA polymerase sigma factor (sigma-70 family)
VHHLYHYLSDRELADLVLRGNRDAFRIIMERTEKLVAHIVSGMIPQREDREDLAQEIYLKAFKSLPGFRYEAKLSTWIGRIAYNTCINFLQKKRLPLTDLETAEVQVAGSEEDPFASLSAKQVSDVLQAAISRLPPLNQTLINLFHREALSIAEIATITALPEGTVKSYLYRARKQLKDNIISIYHYKDAL